MDSDPKNVAAPVPPPAGRSMAQAILTDVHFWVPVIVLILGLALLAYLS